MNLLAAHRRWAAGQDLRRRRLEIAASLRAFLAPHQRALAETTASVVVTDKNRRSGATETWGREYCARAVERDGWVGICVAETRAVFMQNWWLREGGVPPDGQIYDPETNGDGGIALLKQAGFRESRKKRPGAGLEMKLRRVGGDIASVTFPWGSAIYIFGADSLADIQKIRGMRFDDLWADETQNMVHVLTLCKEVAAAAGSERRAQTRMSGTPCADVDSYFAQACQRRLDGVEVHAMRSWDNPVYGETWAERYQQGVIDVLHEKRSFYNVTDVQREVLATLTQGDVLALGQVVLDELPGDANADGYLLPNGSVNLRKLAKEVDPAALREFFARWVGAADVYVYAARFVPPDQLYYARHEQPLAERLAELPRAPDVGTRTRQKRWQAVVISDLGSGGESSRGGLVALLHSPEDPTVYELHSEWLAEGLGEDQQFESAARLCVEIDGLGVPVRTLVYDPGGQGHAIGKSWAPRLSARLMAYGFHGQIPGVVPARKDGRKEDDIRLLNADMRTGHLRGLDGSPLDIEQRALKWRERTRGDQRRVEDVDREVPGPDGRIIRPGNDCCDARLYGWRHCVYVLRGQAADAAPEPGSKSALRAEGQRAARERLRAMATPQRRR